MNTGELNIKAQRMRYVTGDYIAFFVAFFIFDIFRWKIYTFFDPVSLWEYVTLPKLLLEQFFVPIGMVGISWISGYYNVVIGKSRLQEFLSTLTVCALSALILFLLMLLNDKLGRRRDNYNLILTLFGILFICSYSVRLLLTSLTIKKFRHNLWRSKTLFIGDKSKVKNIIRRLNALSNRPGIEMVANFPFPSDYSGIGITQIREFCKNSDVDQIVIVSNGNNDRRVMQTLYHLFDLNLPIKIAPDELAFLTSSIRLNDVYAEPLIDLTSPSMGESSKNIKRVTDVILSIFALLLISPIFLFAIIAIKLTSRGPVFYSQERIGYRHKPFKIYKFRSMRKDAEVNGPQLSTDNDPRVTPIGHWMRKYRVDELPQFWNVIKGEMSLVGPRPERAFFIEKIIKRLPYYTMLSQVRPGITSWGMVKYGYAKNVEEMIKRAKFDLIYISNMSLAMDVKIMIYTVKTILTGKGV